MQNFWYHSPVRFYKTQEELSDMSNPQNAQFFGAKKPYPLEIGVFHRFLLPAYINEVPTAGLKIFVVGDTEYELPCLFKFEGEQLIAVTFRCYNIIQGHFEIRNATETFYYSNCIQFIDSTDSDNRKYVRVITKHNYDKNLFPYSKNPNAYCVTNLPAYELGRFTAEIDAKNNRVGNSASLISSESYTDEIVSYEFKAYGDANIISFLQTHSVNNEFYLNGTKRTAIDKMEVDEFAMLGKLKFTNVKDDLGFNQTIDESAVFSDLALSLIDRYPSINKTYEVDSGLTNFEIWFKFNAEVFNTGNASSKVRLYRNGVLVTEKSFSQLIVSGDRVSFLVSNSSITPGTYHIEIDNNLFKNALGSIYEGIYGNSSWYFTIASSITPSVSISWLDGNVGNLSGSGDSVSMKIKSLITKPDNGAVNYIWESSSNGITYAPFEYGKTNKTFTLNPNNNYFRLKVVLSDSTTLYSNILQYIKEGIAYTNYYYKATRPFDFPGNDFVRYIDQYGFEQTEILVRSHWENLEGNGSGTWVEAPCTLIQAVSILQVQGAVSCIP